MIVNKVAKPYAGFYSKYKGKKIERITISEIFSMSYINERGKVDFTKPHYKGTCECGREVCGDLKNLILQGTPKSCKECRKRVLEEQKEKESTKKDEELNKEYRWVNSIKPTLKLREKPLKERGWLC